MNTNTKTFNQKRLSETSYRMITHFLNTGSTLRNAYSIPKEDYNMGLHLQAWPAVINKEKKTEFSDVAVGVSKLIKAIPERIFNCDAKKIGEYYKIDSDYIESFALRGMKSLDYMSARGDFIDTEDGLKCIEYNMESNLGGWEVSLYKDIYLNDPFIKRFTSAENTSLYYRDTMNIFFEELVREHIKNTKDSQSHIHIALFDEGHTGDMVKNFLNNKLHQFLVKSEHSFGGTIHFGDISEFHVKENNLYQNQIKMNVVIDFGYQVSQEILNCLNENSIVLFNGPISTLLGNKLSISLLSENETNPVFTEEEQAFIKKHIPWSRKIVVGKTQYKEEEIDLVPYIVSNKDQFVLKISDSLSGDNIFLGSSVEQNKWETLIERAVSEKHWVVQERLDSVSYMDLTHESESVPHDVIWGLFSIADTYGGGFVRCLPREKNAVVNRSKGATETIIFETDSQ